MLLHEIKKSTGLKDKSKRLWRWNASWRWNYSTKGLKWQKARSWWSLPAWFEWWQTPLTLRLPKLKWFRRYYKLIKHYDVINLSKIEKDPRFESDMLITKSILSELNYISSENSLVKILWDWDFSKKLNFEWIDSFSKVAKEKIEKNWGKIS